jgi:hypothetical protein
MSERSIFEDAYCAVTYDPDKKLIWYRRKPTQYPSNEVAAKAVTDAKTAMPVTGTLAHHVFMMDVREGPMRSDPGFEAAMRSSGPNIGAQFKRSAVLVKTAVGKLQMTRLLSEQKSPSVVFDDEAKALAWLLGGSEPPRATR